MFTHYNNVTTKSNPQKLVKFNCQTNYMDALQNVQQLLYATRSGLV